jgi:hypothetical protein
VFFGGGIFHVILNEVKDLKVCTAVDCLQPDRSFAMAQDDNYITMGYIL